MNNERVSDLLYQTLQAEQDAGRVYETAIRCTTRDPLKEEWARCLRQTREHEQELLRVFEALGLDPASSTPGREAVRHLGSSLVQAMEQALGGGPSEEAQLVACECVLHAEAKDHLDWELLGQVAGRLKGDEARALAKAHQRIGRKQEERLQHARRLALRVWLESLGMAPVAPQERSDTTEPAGARAARGASV